MTDDDPLGTTIGDRGVDAMLLRAALVGALAWVLFLAVARPPLATALLLVGPLVAVPLGLRLAAPADASRAWRLVSVSVLPATLLATAAFALPAGSRAAALLLPWVGVTGVIALLG